MAGEQEPDEPSSASQSASPLRLVFEAARGHRKSLSAVAVTALLGGFAEAVVLVMIARSAFALASGGSEINASLGPFGSLSIPISVLLGVAAALTVVRVILQVLQARQMAATYTGVWSSARERLMSLYLNASWSLQSEERDGKLQELATTFATGLASTVLSLSSAMVALFSLLAFLLTAFIVNAAAALVVVAAGVGMALLLRPLRNAVRRRARIAAEANLAFATDVTEFAGSMQEVRVFNVERQVLARMDDRVREASNTELRSRFLSLLTPALYQGMAMLLVVGAIAAVYAAGVSRLASIGGIVLIMVRSLSYGQQLQSNYQALYAAAPYFEKLADEERRYTGAAVSKEGESINAIGALTFDHVSYSYEPGRAVLRDISFDLHRGEIVGIIGPSGSGKSTLVQILLRLREPGEGTIRADGRDVRFLSLSDWYRRVSFVPQDVRLFAGTVEDNIRFFRTDIDEAAIERAAKLANLHGEIEAMPSGYQTTVGERGGQISGGQRQRLSIARALAEEPDVIVLDEPTSSLDVRSEALIRESLRGLAEHTTVVVIAHRLSTLDICDRIMVIADGELHGFDAPAVLEETDAFYREALRLSGLR